MTFDRTSVSSALLIGQNARKKAVISDELDDRSQGLINRLSKVEEPGIYNLVGEDTEELTKIAWNIAVSKENWEYEPWLPESRKISADKVIVDNVATTRVASRRIREIRTFDSVAVVLAVTQEPLPEISNMIRVENDQQSKTDQ